MNENKIKTLYEQGLSLRKIGSILGVSRTTINTFVRKKGIKKGKDVRLALAIKSKIESGWTNKQVATFYDVNPVTVWAHLKKIKTSTRQIKNNLTKSK